MEYLTWRQLRGKLNEETNDRVLDEPALFARTDEYGYETVVPMQLIRDTWHPHDSPNSVRYDEGSGEYERLGGNEDNRVLRELPAGALLLHYSDMEEDVEPRTQWLAQPNPHPKSAPLFETPRTLPGNL